MPPESGEHSPPVAFCGSKVASTNAYIFNYPFDILVRPDVTDIRDLHLQGERVTIYPPFRSRPAGLPYVDSLSIKTVPYRPNTTPPDFEWLSAPVNMTAQPAV